MSAWADARRFTITASRFAQAVAVEDRDAFDERFGQILSA
jgi:hypothetical protein